MSLWANASLIYAYWQQLTRDGGGGSGGASNVRPGSRRERVATASLYYPSPGFTQRRRRLLKPTALGAAKI